MTAARTSHGGALRVMRAGLFSLVMSAAGCDRAAAPSSTQPTTAGAPRASADTSRGWVLHPQVVQSEQEVECLRLLSSAPSVTEICCALGLADCLVGRTRYCAYPPAVQAVPSIGALNDLNVEVLLELKPQLVLVSGRSRAITDKLKRLGLRYETLPDVTLEDLFIAIDRVGALTGRSQTARRLTTGLRADLASTAARFADVPPARVLLLIATMPDPPTQVFAAGPGSFYDDLLRLGGHENAAAPSGRPFPPIGLEFVLDADPDVIIELAPDRKSRPGGDVDARRIWSKIGPLKAVRAQRVHVLVGPEHFLLGPRVTQTFAALCETIAGNDHD